MASAPYYAPPSGGGYFGAGRYGVQTPQQQQVTVVSTSQQAPVVYHLVETFTGAVVYACFVTWCCNFLFGLVGYALAG